MAVTNTFKEAVEAKSVRKVRIMMEDSLLIDPTFTEFKEMEKAAASMDGLYDEHDGRSFKMDKNSWDDDYMNELMVQIIRNFSHERLNHLKDVVRYLRPVKENPASVHSTNYNANSGKTGESTSSKKEFTNYQEQKMRDMQEGNYRGTKVAVGTIVGAAIGGTVAVVVEAPVAAGALVGAAVVGTATYIGIERKE